MGCVLSRRNRTVDTDGELSFSHMVIAGNVFSAPAKGEKAAKTFHGSGDVKMSPGKSTVSKVPEMNSIFGTGLEKAVEVLDTLGSSMSDFNTGGGFLFGIVNRGSKISVLAFEVANTIVKGYTLMVSLSEENVQSLKNDIRQSDGIRQLVSTDVKELLCVVATDKREEFNVFSKEVARFGNLCKDPQWHNLARYFQKLDLDPTPQELLREEAKATMQDLLDLAQQTSELYHELHALDRLDQDYQRRLREEDSFPTSQRGEFLSILHGELKQQRKLVNSLKRKSLWSRTFEEVVENLVDIVTFLHKEILVAFGYTGMNITNRNSEQDPRTLGVLRLALHYANTIIQMDNIVSRPLSVPPNARDTLYHGLPAMVKAALRSRLQSFHVKEELDVPLIKSEMHKILHWLVPMAENTVKAHQGFGWVGEWANTSIEFKKKAPQCGPVRIQTLYHADEDQTNEYILQLAVWLHHLVSKVKHRGHGLKTPRSNVFSGGKNTPLPSDSNRNLSFASDDKSPIIIQLSEEDRKMLESMNSRRLILRRSKSHGCIEKEKEERIIRTHSSSCRDLGRSPDFEIRRTRLLDVMDGLGIVEVPARNPSLH